MDLWHLEELPLYRVTVPSDILRVCERALGSEPGVSKYCRLVGNELQVRGIKRSHIDSLKKHEDDPDWLRFLDKQVAEGWAQMTHPETHRRMVEMEALGMEKLSEIVKPEEGGRVREEQLAGKVNSKDLADAAVRYGRPFDLVARLPETITSQIEENAIPTMEAQIEHRIQPRLIMLMFAVGGFVSLIVSLLTVLTRYGSVDLIQSFALTPAFSITVLVVGLITIAVLILLLVPHWRLQKRGAPTGGLGELAAYKREVDELRAALKAVRERCDALESRAREGNAGHGRVSEAVGELPSSYGKS